jgi:hypothetical protein
VNPLAALGAGALAELVVRAVVAVAGLCVWAANVVINVALETATAAETRTRVIEASRGKGECSYYQGVNFDPTWLFLSMIPSGIGFVLFVYGKKQERWPHLVAGIVFSVYPYFTSSIAAMLGVGTALGAALWLAVRAGW